MSQPPRRALCRLRVASCVAALLAESCPTSEQAGPFGVSVPPAPGPAASTLHLPARNGRGTRRTRVTRALSVSMLHEGSHAPCRRRRPFGFDAIQQQVSCVCVCRASPTLSCWSGAACRFTSQSPLQPGWAALSIPRAPTVRASLFPTRAAPVVCAVGCLRSAPSQLRPLKQSGNVSHVRSAVLHGTQGALQALSQYGSARLTAQVCLQDYRVTRALSLRCGSSLLNRTSCAEFFNLVRAPILPAAHACLGGGRAHRICVGTGHASRRDERRSWMCSRLFSSRS